MKVNIDWDKMTPKHNIKIPEHNHVVADEHKDMLATMLVEHRNKKQSLLSRLLKRIF